MEGRVFNSLPVGAVIIVGASTDPKDWVMGRPDTLHEMNRF